MNAWEVIAEKAMELKTLLDEVVETMPDREYDRVEPYAQRVYSGANEIKIYTEVIQKILSKTKTE